MRSVLNKNDKPPKTAKLQNDDPNQNDNLNDNSLLFNEPGRNLNQQKSREFTIEPTLKMELDNILKNDESPIQGEPHNNNTIDSDPNEDTVDEILNTQNLDDEGLIERAYEEMDQDYKNGV